MQLAAELIAGPALVGLASLAAVAWDARIGGLVSAFPAVVGPVLLILAHEHGAAFAASAAGGTLVGLVSLAAFALGYGHAAVHRGWATSLAAGWAAAAVSGAAAASVAGGPPAGLAVATLSLGLAYALLPRAGGGAAAAPPGWEIPLRMGLTAVLIAAIAAVAGEVGALLGGILAALPLLASVLAAFTHARQGSGAAIALLRGMVLGMTGFVAFCVVVAALVVPAGVGAAFAAATACALIAQAITASHAGALTPTAPR